MNYRFTNHLRERFLERTHSKFNHLQTCKADGCSTCRSLLYEIYNKSKSKNEIDTLIREALAKSTEDRSFINNSQFMHQHYEKYGYDERFTFLRGENVIFVVIQKSDEKNPYNLIVTCIPNDTHIVGKARKKFSKAVA